MSDQSEITRRGVIGSIASTLAIGATASTASAQSTETGSGNSSSTSTESRMSDLADGAERIDGSTVLVSSDYDGNSTATLTFASTETQGVTLADAGAFVAGGTVGTKTVVLRPEESPQTVQMTVTNADGYVGVSVSTADTLYAVPLSTTSTISLSPSSPNDMMALALGAGVVGPGAVLAGHKLRERRRANGVVHVG